MQHTRLWVKIQRQPNRFPYCAILVDRMTKKVDGHRCPEIAWKKEFTKILFHGLDVKRATNLEPAEVLDSWIKECCKQLSGQQAETLRLVEAHHRSRLQWLLVLQQHSGKTKTANPSMEDLLADIVATIHTAMTETQAQQLHWLQFTEKNIKSWQQALVLGNPSLDTERIFKLTQNSIPSLASLLPPVNDSLRPGIDALCDWLLRYTEFLLVLQKFYELHFAAGRKALENFRNRLLSSLPGSPVVESINTVFQLWQNCVEQIHQETLRSKEYHIGFTEFCNAHTRLTRCGRQLSRQSIDSLSLSANAEIDEISHQVEDFYHELKRCLDSFHG